MMGGREGRGGLNYRACDVSEERSTVGGKVGRGE